MTIRLKIQDGVSRPYLTKDEYLDLMKEHAYGIYSPSSQKASTAAKQTDFFSVLVAAMPGIVARAALQRLGNQTTNIGACPRNIPVQ